MGAPLHHLPVLQNWDCHVCGSCCKEYRVTITDEERRRIEAQGWKDDPEIGGRPLFIRRGPFWARRYHLNHRADGSCVFLSEQGRCRIHERFGYETKPLACRLFPFVLIPVADHWRVSLRFACPSAAANKGRPLPAHDKLLEEFAARLAEREGLERRPDGSLLKPPYLHGTLRMDWPDLLCFVQALLILLRNRNDRVERRLRKCLALAQLCRRSRFDKLTGARLTEFLGLMTSTLDTEVPADPATLPPPSWIGRVLFRQAAAIFTRKDHGPTRGPAMRTRLGLLHAATRFAWGKGLVPRLHAWIPETTFEKLEQPVGPLSEETEQILERYYLLKVGSLQFCGPAYFGLPFWEGLEALALTLPVLLWVARAFGNQPSGEGIIKALSIVDDHFGFNRVLAFSRQRICFRILVRMDELPRLIAWYSR
jgi:lysine-N-methylase